MNKLIKKLINLQSFVAELLEDKKQEILSLLKKEIEDAFDGEELLYGNWLEIIKKLK